MNNVGERLEYFFWRIWSSDRIRTTIRGSQVAILYQNISEGSIIRTTPTSSPRNSRVYAIAQRARDAGRASQVASDEDELALPDTTAASPELLSIARRPEFTTASSQDTIVPLKDGSHRERSRPPPVLKTPGMDYSGKGKTARIKTPGWGTRRNGDEPEDGLAVEDSAIPQGHLPSPLSQTMSTTDDMDAADEDDRFDENASPLSGEQAAQRPSAPRMQRSTSGSGSAISGRGGKKKASFVAPSASSRRRPVLPRRKSSQASPSSGSAKIPSPDLGSSRYSSIAAMPPEQEAEDAPGVQGATTPTPGNPMLNPTSRSASPISDSPFRRPSRDHQSEVQLPAPSATAWTPRTEVGKARSEWSPLLGSGKVTDRSRSVSALSFAALATKAGPASSASTSFQAAGNVTSNAPAVLARPPSVLTRASSVLKGKGKAMIDIADSSLLQSTGQNKPPNADATLKMPTVVPRTESQSQLSGLLEEDRRRETERDRRRGRGGPGKKKK